MSLPVRRDDTGHGAGFWGHGRATGVWGGLCLCRMYGGAELGVRGWRGLWLRLQPRCRGGLLSHRLHPLDITVAAVDCCAKELGPWVSCVSTLALDGLYCGPSPCGGKNVIGRVILGAAQMRH